MKVAIVTDWLAVMGGAEKLLLELIKCFPDADIYVTVYSLKPDDQKLFGDTKIFTSFIQKLPFAKKKFDYYLPLMPLAVEQHDLSDYDAIISSSFAFAKNVITAPEQFHFAYILSPIRCAWDMQNVYLKNSPNMSGKLIGGFARIGLHYLRLCDLRSINAVDAWFCISNYINLRIKKYYDRNAQVIYPPVDLIETPISSYDQKYDKYYVTCSRLVEYKRVDLIISAFIKSPNRKLVIIGEGPMDKKLKAIAKNHNNIIFAGRVDENSKQNIIAQAQAFIYAAKEDFGISMVEAQALGIPVIAYGIAGALEIVVGIEDEAPTGLFFYHQTSEAILEAIDYFEHKKEKFVPAVCRLNANRFSSDRFRNEFKQFFEASWNNFLLTRKL